MLARERQSVIADMVRERGAVRVSELTRELDVSDMTVRRDLDRLARLGILDKVHGGATVPGRTSTDEPGFERKSDRERVEKDAIASLASTLVRPGYAVGLSAGTTTWTLAHQLVDVPRITVVTNSVRIATVFYQQPRGDQTIILTGGVRTPSDALVGPVAVAALRSLNLDLVFMGVHGMDEQTGFSSPNLLEAETGRALAHAGRRLAVVADHTKWGVIGLSTIAALDDADVVVTDEGLHEDAMHILRDRVGDVLVAALGATPEESDGRPRELPAP
ncbi:MAG TPA: DeoR/GlpR family DNA-binding transcription regulator [Actinomycetes bacterium]